MYRLNIQTLHEQWVLLIYELWKLTVVIYIKLVCALTLKILVTCILHDDRSTTHELNRKLYLKKIGHIVTQLPLTRTQNITQVVG